MCVIFHLLIIIYVILATKRSLLHMLPMVVMGTESTVLILGKNTFQSLSDVNMRLWVSLFVSPDSISVLSCCEGILTKRGKFCTKKGFGRCLLDLTSTSPLPHVNFRMSIYSEWGLWVLFPITFTGSIGRQLNSMQTLSVPTYRQLTLASQLFVDIRLMSWHETQTVGSFE